MSDAELRTWAESHPNMPQAVAVLKLLEDVAGMSELALALAERVYLQHGSLAKRAERKDGV